MNWPADQIRELKDLYGEIKEATEGGFTYLLIAKLPLPEGCTPPVTEALFCPSPRDGYAARLYFPARIPCRVSPNWTKPVRVLERDWHAYSWKIGMPNQRLAQLVQTILRGLRP